MSQELKQKAHPCPYCNESFDYNIELGLHLASWHRGKPTPTTPLATQNKPQPQTKPQTTQQEELIIEYNLAQSKQGLGELCPVLKDANGNIIDGFHRKGENADWREETIPWIDTPVKLELARLAVNFNRRRVTPQELTERLTFLAKAGLKADEIATQTGISKTTIYRYLPKDLKNEKAIKISGALKAKSEIVRKEVPPETSYKKIHDTNPISQIKQETDKLTIATSPYPELKIPKINYEKIKNNLTPTEEKQTTTVCICPNCHQPIHNCQEQPDLVFKLMRDRDADLCSWACVRQYILSNKEKIDACWYVSLPMPTFRDNEPDKQHCDSGENFFKDFLLNAKKPTNEVTQP